MEERTLLKRSSKGLQVQLITIGVATLFLGLLTTWLINRILGPTQFSGLYLKLGAWVVFILGWAYGSFNLWYLWKIKRYEIGPHALIVHAKAGKMGMEQAVYRYESIISLRMTQNFLGRQFGYGDIRISMPKLDYDVVLYDIDHPTEQILEIQKRIRDHSGGSQSLIS